MITLKNVKNLNGAIVNRTIDSPITQVIDGEGRLMMMPALIDIFALFKEDRPWEQTAREYIEAGITSVFDNKACSAKDVAIHQQHTEKMAAQHNLPLHVHFFFDGNNPQEFDVIGKNKSSVAGIKITLDLAQKPIAPPHISALDRLFQIAAQENMIVTVALIQGNEGVEEQRKTARISVEQTLKLAEKYSTELCLQHVRTKEELDRIQDAKKRGLLIHVEVAYPHLFLTDKDFPKGTQFNHATLFLPDEQDQEALWAGINNGSVDMVGSSGVFSPPDLLLPLLMESHAEKRISLDKIVEVTHINAEVIFRLPQNHDVVLVDPDAYKKIPQDIIDGNPILSHWGTRTFSGWPVYVITEKAIFSNKNRRG
ncbi:MAG: hypothetical protein WCF65_03485 [Parachlamydiaceae bacterium]